MEGACSTGQSPQRAVVPVEEEDKIKKNDMGGACGTCGWRTYTCIQALHENLKGKVHFEHPGVDERIILKWILNE
jgi:Fe-S cluster biogenesis protein NfuA